LAIIFIGLAWGCGEIIMDVQTEYGWQGPYQSALLETDWIKIEEKI
jgi:hypothetical protein